MSATPGTPIAPRLQHSSGPAPRGSLGTQPGAPPSPPRQGRMPPPCTPAPQPLGHWNRVLETATRGGISPCPERAARLRRRWPRSPGRRAGQAWALAATRTAPTSSPQSRPPPPAAPQLPPAQLCLREPARAWLPGTCGVLLSEAIGSRDSAARPGGLGTSRVLSASVSPATACSRTGSPPPPATTTRDRRRSGCDRRVSLRRRSS